MAGLPRNRPMPSMKPILEIADLKALARRRVPKLFFDYADSGAWTESTYRANEADFARIKLRQKVMVDMSGRSLATTMAGQPVAMPLALAPTGLCGIDTACPARVVASERPLMSTITFWRSLTLAKSSSLAR